MRSASILAVCGLLVSEIGLAQRRQPNTDPLSKGGRVVVIQCPAWVPHSLEELVDRADLIVDGVVEQVLSARLWNPQDPTSHCTDSVIAVKRALKGSVTGKVAVSQRGGKIGAVEVWSDQDSFMERGERYILFLMKDTRPPASDDKEFFFVSGTWSGKFKVVDGKAVAHPHATPELAAYSRKSADELLQRIEKRVAAVAGP